MPFQFITAIPLNVWKAAAALVEPENHDALADALETLYGDSQLRASLADQGRQDVESYDMRRMTRRFMELVSTGPREGEVIAQ